MNLAKSIRSKLAKLRSTLPLRVETGRFEWLNVNWYYINSAMSMWFAAAHVILSFLLSWYSLVDWSFTRYYSRIYSIIHSLIRLIHVYAHHVFSITYTSQCVIQKSRLNGRDCQEHNTSIAALCATLFYKDFLPGRKGRLHCGEKQWAVIGSNVTLYMC